MNQLPSRPAARLRSAQESAYLSKLGSYYSSLRDSGAGKDPDFCRAIDTFLDELRAIAAGGSCVPPREAA